MINKKHSIRCVIADDHELFRIGLRQVLETLEVEIVGEATNGKELVDLVQQFKPDLAIVDILMPVLNGIEAAREIKKILPDTAIIGLSMHTDKNIILEMTKAGASGFLDKEINRTMLEKAISTVVLQKENFFPSFVGPDLQDKLSIINTKRATEVKRMFTEKELEIIRLICAEFTTKEIADKLKLSKRTVETHRERIMDKMQVKNLAGLVVFAHQHEMIY
jgi:DNA-binding NarL/FixJ family response regulator